MYPLKGGRGESTHQESQYEDRAESDFKILTFLED